MPNTTVAPAVAPTPATNLRRETARFKSVVNLSTTHLSPYLRSELAMGGILTRTLPSKTPRSLIGTQRSHIWMSHVGTIIRFFGVGGRTWAEDAAQHAKNFSFSVARSIRELHGHNRSGPAYRKLPTLLIRSADCCYCGVWERRFGFGKRPNFCFASGLSRSTTCANGSGLHP
jgi:hypothetical protein